MQLYDDIYHSLMLLMGYACHEQASREEAVLVDRDGDFGVKHYTAHRLRLHRAV